MRNDLTGVPAEYLYCRAFAHPWDHGPAPMQRDTSQVPVLWVSRGNCTSCKTKRVQWYAQGTGVKLTEWDYTHPSDWYRHMHLVTKMDARMELGRREEEVRAARRKAG